MQFQMSDRTIGVAEAWTVLTAASAVAGISFLHGALSPLGMNFLFLFGLEDILVATIYASIAIIMIAIALAVLIAACLWFVRVFNKEAQFDNLLVNLLAFTILTLIIISLSMRFMSASGSQTTVATLYMGPLFVLLGLAFFVFCYRAFRTETASIPTTLQKLIFGALSFYFLLVAAPEEFGFFVGIYIWDGPNQLLRLHEPADPILHETCGTYEQVVWVGSKATVLRCGTDLVVIVAPGDLRATSLLVHHSR